MRVLLVEDDEMIGHSLREALQGQGWSVDTDRVPDASRITPPVQHPAKGFLNPVELMIDLEPGFEVGKLESPYHQILDVRGERTIGRRGDASARGRARRRFALARSGEDAPRGSGRDGRPRS